MKTVGESGASVDKILPSAGTIMKNTLISIQNSTECVVDINWNIAKSTHSFYHFKMVKDLLFFSASVLTLFSADSHCKHIIIRNPSTPISH